MPIYEYLCEDCGRIAEVVQKVGERPPRTCPECGGRKLARLVSRSAFQLKGGGWYSDLYSTPKKKGAAGEKPGVPPAGTSADTAAPAAPPKEPPASPAKPGKKG